ncbi:hypothetical protein EST38_g490 [Candolleomyces aberdarensis]|uniref:NmrA-like domain-containing protein n=1 Tax=Candolleomyces aberdarensis TaxID=2316362 RepID=A0A4Q2DXA3_9AGAR|nr:hypothetical protein EST38_g490 [Candolleomyces aberdarensis]
MSSQFFFLGATGYIGSQFLESAKRDAALYAILKEFNLVALVRDPESAKSKQLQEVWPGVVLVKGTLDDLSLIEEQARNSALIFNAANADHEPSIKAIITGLQKRSADHPSGPKPLYIHTSGLGILSDNSRGEKVPTERLVYHSDTTFKLEDFPPTNPHHSPDSIIHAARVQKENPIRAISVYPGAVYGLGEGITPDALLPRLFVSLYVQTGVAGTWGPGHNALSVIHIKDVGTAFVKIFKLALEGKAQDVYFIADDKAEPVVAKPFAEEIGKILHAHDLLKDPEHKPFPEAVTNNFGEIGWGAFGGNLRGIPDRLKAEGWEPTETAKLSFWDSLPLEVEHFVATYKASRT